jgi:SCY1-like protein 2
MIDKRQWDKKKSEAGVVMGSANMKDETLGILKRDPQCLMKLRHPSILNLIEQPSEDDKYIVFITEPVEFSLACLMEANSSKPDLRDKIPSVLEIKGIALELMETLNFLHQNAKFVHGGLAPETLFLTKDGKIKIGGFNFCTHLGTEE